MKPIIVSIDDRLANPGEALPYAGHLDEDTYTLGEHTFSLPKGIDYDLVLTNAGEGILVTGILKANATAALRLRRWILRQRLMSIISLRSR